jgi:hypothetical protein
MIDWTLPCETTDNPPRPVRVLATDRPNPDRPIIVMRDDGQVFTVGSDGIGNPQGYSGGTYGRITLRNVAPPKPEPVMYESWFALYNDGIASRGYPTEAKLNAEYTDHGCVEVFRKQWMSDGSPVPGEGKTAEYKADRDWLSQKYQDMIAERDSLKSEVEKLRRANATQAKIYERQKPVVDAAIVWERHFTQLAGDRLVVAVRAYQSTPKKTAAEAVANVKSCEMCRFDISICGYGTHIPGCGWEAKSHD